MAEVVFLFVPDTPTGLGLFFLDITYDTVRELARWWIWDKDGWCGPVDPAPSNRRQRSKSR